MNKFISLLAIILPMGCAHQDEWTSDDTVWEGLYIATIVADAYMTNKIQDHPNIIENGPIAKYALGTNPSTSATLMYFVTVGVTHYLVARALPRGWRTFWQVGGIYEHTQAVNHGHQLGIFSEPCTVHPCVPTVAPSPIPTRPTM